ncbi:MAG: ABC transporter permease [Helicobacteraceae bacterium]|jgi:putative ABC transport system permease protein|nr:ABC transporter permease [Helicobacteraceae bacterium]
MGKSANVKMFVTALFAFFLRRRSRAATAFLAIAIGATALFGMMTIYYDLPDRLAKVFRAYGANLVLVGEEALTKEEIENIREFLPQDSLIGIAPYAYRSLMLNSRLATAAYTDLSEALAISPYWQIKGRLPENAKEALIGSDLADTLNVKIGSAVKLKDVNEDVLITGIVKTGGSGDMFLFLEIEAMGVDYAADLAEVSVSLTGDGLERLQNSLRERFPHITPKPIKRVANSEASTLNKIEALVALATIVVLALTLICVSTTMTAIVLERLKEIGLKKAIGARSGAIITEFLSEALVLGLVGGAFGCALGFAFANYASNSVFGVSVNFSLALAVASTLISIVFTAFAAIFPVYSAANINPIIALRGE